MKQAPSLEARKIAAALVLVSALAIAACSRG
jgi:hypothetical protein